MTIEKDGSPITSLEDWETRAGPKHKSQWKDGRSAKETARAWLGTNESSFPPEVAEVLASHPDFGEILTWKAEPEARLPFDQFPGEPRNTDLAINANDQHGSFFLAVEAKADEPFGETVEDALAAAVERKLKNPRSNRIARIQQLPTSLLGATQRKGAVYQHPPLSVAHAKCRRALYCGKT